MAQPTFSKADMAFRNACKKEAAGDMIKADEWLSKAATYETEALEAGADPEGERRLS